MSNSANLARVMSIFSGGNRVINGNMRIDQQNQGNVQSVPTGANFSYTLDMFYVYPTGANITSQQITLADGQNRMRLSGAAGSSAIVVGHRIEAMNSSDLAGGNASLQVKLSSSSLTTATWTVYYANTTDTFGTASSPTRTQIATGSFSVSSVEEVKTATFPIPAAATTGLEIVLSFGGLGASHTVTIGDLWLERGSILTNPQWPLICDSLIACQRYYEEGDYAMTLPFSNASVVANFTIWVPWKVTKRVVPSVSGSSNIGTFTAVNVRVSGAGLGRSDTVANRIENGTYKASARL